MTACTFLSDHVKIYVKTEDTRLSVLMGDKRAKNAGSVRNSALQTPELSRYELDCLLRREGGKAPLAGWAGLIASRLPYCANSNIEIA
jgi:hypothetical protein